jgi:hypothetical protein
MHVRNYIYTKKSKQIYKYEIENKLTTNFSKNKTYSNYNFFIKNKSNIKICPTQYSCYINFYYNIYRSNIKICWTKLGIKHQTLKKINPTKLVYLIYNFIGRWRKYIRKKRNSKIHVYKIIIQKYKLV